MAYNDGYTSSGARTACSQWANLYQPASRHYAGGYGYLNVDGTDDQHAVPRPPGSAAITRDVRRRLLPRALASDGIGVTETVYAPFGNDPVLLDDVTLKNQPRWHTTDDAGSSTGTSTRTTRSLALPAQHRPRQPGLDALATATLSVAQNDGRAGDTAPLSIFAAALSGPVDGL